jgi:hypothetical protein
MRHLLSRLMRDAHAEQVVLAFHLVITAIVFAFLGMQVVVN